MSYIYIACSLTHVKKVHFEEYTSFIKTLAEQFKLDFGIDCKYALKDSDPQLREHAENEQAKLCYAWDRKMVEESELVVADVSFPSTGLGMEIEIANQIGVPVLLVYRHYTDSEADEKSYTLNNGENHTLVIGNKIVSVMVQGCPAVIGEIQYAGTADGVEKVKSFIGKMDSKPFSTIA